MPNREEQTPGHNRNPQPHGDDLVQPDDERQRQPGSDRDAEEEDEEL